MTESRRTLKYRADRSKKSMYASGINSEHKISVSKVNSIDRTVGLFVNTSATRPVISDVRVLTFCKHTLCA